MFVFSAVFPQYCEVFFDVSNSGRVLDKSLFVPAEPPQHEHTIHNEQEKEGTHAHTCSRAHAHPVRVFPSASH